MNKKETHALKARALTLHRKGAFKEAIPLYRDILEKYPEDVDIMSNLGSIYRSINRSDIAVTIHRNALDINPENAGAKLNLANALKDLHYYAEAIAIYLDLLRCEPENKQYLLNLAVAYRDSGDHQRAVNLLLSLKCQYPSDDSILWELAQNYLRMGDYENGWRYFESRWSIGKITLPKFDIPVWKGESLKRKHILIIAEQGYGDTLLMARYIPKLASLAEKVTLLCKAELHLLFHKEQVACISDPEKGSDADYLVPIMSLPTFLGQENEKMPPPYPFLVDSDRVERFRQLLPTSNRRPNVGIVWSGSVTFQNNHNRSLRLQRLLLLLSPFNIKLFSFQKGSPAKELHDKNIDNAIADVGSLCKDFADTAAALQAMDFIVMTDSSVAHLAASLGKPVINLLNHNSYWLYGVSGMNSPWYPSMRLVRQQIPGVWESLKPELNRVMRSLIDKQSESTNVDPRTLINRASSLALSSPG